MADALRVDAVALHLANDHMTAAADAHAATTARHLDDFTDGVSRWRGAASAAALREAAERWEARHAERHRQIAALSQRVTDAARMYAATDSASSEDIDAVPTIGASAGGTLPADLGL